MVEEDVRWKKRRKEEEKRRRGGGGGRRRIKDLDTRSFIQAVFATITLGPFFLGGFGVFL